MHIYIADHRKNNASNALNVPRTVQRETVFSVRPEQSICMSGSRKLFWLVPCRWSSDSEGATAVRIELKAWNNGRLVERRCCRSATWATRVQYTARTETEILKPDDSPSIFPLWTKCEILICYRNEEQWLCWSSSSNLSGCTLALCPLYKGFKSGRWLKEIHDSLGIMIYC